MNDLDEEENSYDGGVGALERLLKELKEDQLRVEELLQKIKQQQREVEELIVEQKIVVSTEKYFDQLEYGGDNNKRT